MSTLAHQRCRNHAQREAVARCPECRRYFCRECVTEHEDRVVCSSCLVKLAGGDAEKKWRISGVVQFGQFAAGLFLLWICFYVMGRLLLNIPSEFHDESFWAADTLTLGDE
ncbi:MAG: rhomboid family protein [Candidatus Hydrogenedentes bacterium]|nr:rhomboid family protein [Candidatus Hydrogenedentota bacterium]